MGVLALAQKLSSKSCEPPIVKAEPMKSYFEGQLSQLEKNGADTIG